MSRSFTQYWKNATWNNHNDESLDHSASNEFKARGVDPGSRIFIVTNIKGVIHVGGVLTVEKLVGQKEAQALLGQSLWKAKDHVIARGRQRFMRGLRVPMEIVKRLRFVGNKPLVLKRNGMLDQQTLRGVRELTAGSAKLLEGLLAGAGEGLVPTNRSDTARASGSIAEIRSDVAAVRQVFDRIFDGVAPEARRRWEEFLATSIEYAASKVSDRWVIVLNQNKKFIRTTIGLVRCLDLSEGKNQVVLLSRRNAPSSTRWSGGRYDNAPGCEEAYLATTATAAALRSIHRAHFRAIDACGRANAGNNQRRRAHSPGVLRYLEEVLGRKLPNPTYVGATAGQSNTSGVTTPQNWWVNHNRTHGQEIEGEYIWAPKTSKIKIDKVSYTNLTKVLPGDLVFAHAGGAIRAVGIATGRARDAPNPAKVGATGRALRHDLGWQVPVKFVELAAPLRVRAHAKELSAVLPEKHSPIGVTGDVTGGIYLAAVPTPMAAVLRRLLGSRLEGALSQLEGAVGRDVADQDAEERIQQRTDIGPTQKARLINARRGQGIYRKNLEQIEKCCRVTGVSDGLYLRASHIKPWCKSDDKERLDGYNGLLLAPHVDLLFDEGWISFSDDGKLLLSTRVNRKILTAWGIPADLKVGKFRPEQCKYLAWHRKAFGFAERGRRRAAP